MSESEEVVGTEQSQGDPVPEESVQAVPVEAAAQSSTSSLPTIGDAAEKTSPSAITIYLDGDLCDHLTTLAEQQGATADAVAYDILRRWFYLTPQGEPSLSHAERPVLPQPQP